MSDREAEPPSAPSAPRPKPTASHRRRVAAVLGLAALGALGLAAALRGTAVPVGDCASQCAAIKAHWGFCGAGESGEEAEAKAGPGFQAQLKLWAAASKAGCNCPRPRAFGLVCD